MASDADARYDDEVDDRRGDDRADGDVGHQPGPVGRRRRAAARPGERRDRSAASTKRWSSWASTPGSAIGGTRIDVAFVGSCTNARLSDLREAARVVRGHRVAPHVQGARGAGLAGGPAGGGSARASTASSCDAGFEWRGAGCSMCLAMNPDRLEGREICASSSNRNFKGRQGSPTGRTLLMSPAMVAAAAVAGEVVDVRELPRDGD